MGRIAHSEGVAFAALETGPGDAELAVEIAEHPFGPVIFTGRRWPLRQSGSNSVPTRLQSR